MIGSQDDLLNFLDTSTDPIDKKASNPFSNIKKEEKLSLVVSPTKSPLKSAKQSSLFSFIKKREDKEESKKTAAQISS